MNTLTLPLCADMKTQIFCYIPTQSDTVPSICSSRYSIYFPPSVLQSLQIKPGSWTPIQPFHTTLLSLSDQSISTEQSSVDPISFFSQQLSTIAQIQPMMETQFPPPSFSIGSHLKPADPLHSVPSQFFLSQQELTDHPDVFKHQQIFNSPENHMIHLPSFNHPICVSPHLFAHLLLSISLFNNMYPDSLSSTPSNKHDSITPYKPQFHNQHYFLFSNIPVSKHPSHPLHPSTMYQSAYMTMKFNQFSFLNPHQPHLASNMTNFGYILNNSILSFSNTVDQVNLVTDSVFSYLSTSNAPPKSNHSQLASSPTHTTIQFIPLFAIINKLKPQLIQKAQAQVDSETIKRDMILTPQSFTLNTMQYLFSLLYQRIISFIPSTKPSTVGHNTVGKQDKHLQWYNKTSKDLSLHKDPQHCTVIPTSLQILIGQPLHDVKQQLQARKAQKLETQSTRDQSPPHTTSPISTQPNLPAFLSLLASHWSEHINISIKGYLAQSTSLFYNILLSTLSSHSSLRIQSLLINGGVGSGKTVFSQQISTVPFVTSFYYDFSNINFLTFHHTLSTLLSQVQQRILNPIFIPHSQFPQYLCQHTTSPSSSPNISSFPSQIQQTVTHIPLVHTLVFDNMDVLFDSSPGQEHLRKAKHEITQLILSFLTTPISLSPSSLSPLPSPSSSSSSSQSSSSSSSSSPPSSHVSLYPIILCVFTSRAGSSNASSQLTSNPHSHQKDQSLQYNLIYQQLLTTMTFKLQFLPLTDAQRFAILSHYLQHSLLSFQRPSILIYLDNNLLNSTNEQNEQNEQNQQNQQNEQNDQVTPSSHLYSTCLHCNHMIYPTHQNVDETKYHIYTKEDMIQEWAQTLHGCSPAVIQQLCSLSIIAAYKRHNSSTLSSISTSQSFKTNSLCISHKEWIYALELCKLYHATPHQLIPQILSTTTQTTTFPTVATTTSFSPVLYPTIHTSIHHIFRQYWAGYLPQLTQLMAVFTQQSQSPASSLQFTKSYINYNHLISSPSGMGKTRLAELISLLLRLKMISVDVATLTSKYVGGSNALINQLFIQARNSAPCILLFENIDTFIVRKTKKILVNLFPHKSIKKNPHSTQHPAEDIDNVLSRLFTEGESIFDGFETTSKTDKDISNPELTPLDNLDTSINDSKPIEIDHPPTQINKSYQPYVHITRSFAYCNPILENILKQLDHIAQQRQIHHEHQQQMDSIQSTSTSQPFSLSSSSSSSSQHFHELPNYLTDSLNSPLGLFSYPQNETTQLSQQIVSSTASSYISQQRQQQQQQHHSILPNPIDSIVVIATTHLPISQLPPTLITSTRFIHTVELKSPSLIQRAQIFAQMISSKPFITRKQFFESNSISKQFNIIIEPQYNSQIIPLSSDLPLFSDQETDPFYLALFPTYQHLTMFVALFSTDEVTNDLKQDDPTTSKNNNLSTVDKTPISAATLAAIIDASVLDAVRDNIQYQMDKTLDDTTSHSLIPLTPKNVISGLRVICAYNGNVHHDIKLVDQHLDAISFLATEQLSLQPNQHQPQSWIFQQQSTFSLPDFIEEYEYIVENPTHA